MVKLKCLKILFYVPVKVDKKWGYVDGNNKMVIKPKYDYAESFYNGSAEVGYKKKTGVVDGYLIIKNGKITEEFAP